MSLWERTAYAASQRRRRRFSWLADSRDKSFKTHATAIGQLAIQWNLLHEALGLVFLSVMQGGHGNQYAQVWSAVPSDGAKREMLLAASEGAWLHPDAPEEQNRRRELVRALVKELVKAATALEDARNNAIHAPLTVALNALRPDFGAISPDISLNNKRAQRLLNKDLLAEFRWCRDYAFVLGVFALALHESLWNPQLKLPKLPPPKTKDQDSGKGTQR